MASIKPDKTEALESAPVLVGDVVALISEQNPPGQLREHLSASHWKAHSPPLQICWHSFTPGAQIILQRAPMQL